MWRNCQAKEFIHHSQHKLHAIGDPELVVKTFDVCVDGMPGDVELRRDGIFRAVFKHAMHNFQFASLKLQTLANCFPSDAGEHRRICAPTTAAPGTAPDSRRRTLGVHDRLVPVRFESIPLSVSGSLCNCLTCPEPLGRPAAPTASGNTLCLCATYARNSSGVNAVHAFVNCDGLHDHISNCHGVGCIIVTDQNFANILPNNQDEASNVNKINFARAFSLALYWPENLRGLIYPCSSLVK